MYDDLDSAAQAFYKNLGEHNVDQEEAGVIYGGPDGKYYDSIPTIQHDDSFKLRAQQTAQQKLAAIFHTHPGNDQDAQWFSPNDISAAQQLKVPSYIYFEGQHDMRKFIPGTTKTHSELLAGQRMNVAKGDPLAQQQLIADTLRK